MADGYKSVGDDDPQYVPPDGTATDKTDKESESTSSVGDSPVPGNEQQGGFSYDPFQGTVPVQPQQPGPVPGSYQSVPQTQSTPQESPAYQPYQQPFSQPAYGYGQPAVQSSRE